MADIDVPEADAIEQEDLAEELADLEEPDLGVEIPEADAVEQAQDVAATPHARLPGSIRDDVPEADALEQAQGVGPDDDYRG